MLARSSGYRALKTLAMILATMWLLGATPSQGGGRPPERLRFRVHSVLWWSNGLGGGRTESTDYFDSAPGDDIDGSRAYPGWMPFGPGAPFRLGAIVDAEHAWVHFSGGIHPTTMVPGGDGSSGGDSIIVSTVDRSFTSGSFDAGLEFTLRIEPTSSSGISTGMQIIRHGPAIPPPRGLRPGHGALLGRILHAGSGAPIVGAAVRVEGSGGGSHSGAGGRFELVNLQIGQSRLFVVDSLGEVSAPVGVTDEKADSLDVRVAQPGDPDPAPRSPEAILAEVRAKQRASGEGYVPLYDVTPTAYRRSDPTYPVAARQSKFEGDVIVRARIDSIGRQSNLSTQGGASPQILSMAEACVRRWRFRPGLKDARPVGCWLGQPVHFAHPASDNIAPPGDRRSQAATTALGGPGRTRAEIVVEGSATLDSVTKMYRYYYRVANHGTSTRYLAAFVLMPVEPPVEELDRPDGWQGILGRDFVGWEVWGDDHGRNISDYAIGPNEELVGIGFKSPRPPTRIRWFADTAAPGEQGKLIWDWAPDAQETMLKTPLQGTIVGPGSEQGH